jgi:iron complex outermembrane receptor protein
MQQTLFAVGDRARFIRKAGLVGLFAASCLTAPSLAMAQQAAAPQAAPSADASQSTVGEVLVTARRRSERLQDVPISVVALSNEQLTQKGVTTANDLDRVAPGLSIMNTAASRSAVTYSIRGQGSTFGSGPGVIPYFDEVANFSNAIFDLANVQVLKGPQGTLFGRNTTGGAILFTPDMPTDHYTGYVDGRFGNYNRKDLEFGVGGPILGDTLMFRVAGQILSRDGFTTDVVDHSKLDNENKENFRAILAWHPTTDFDNTFLVQATKEHEHGDGAVLTHVNQAAPDAAFLPPLQPSLDAQKALGIRTVLGDFPLHYLKNDTFGVIDTANYRVNDMLSFKNIVSYLKTNGEKDWDLDATNLPALGVENPPNESQQFTEEFQSRIHVGTISGNVGYYYERTWTPFQIGFVEVSPLLFGIIHQDAEVVAESSDSISHGPYAQFDWKIIPQVTLTGGVRYTTDDVYSGRTGTTLIASIPAPPLNTLGFAFAPSISKTFNALTWNAAIEYAVDPGLNLYGHVSRGYKQGGFNGTAPPTLQSYQPEFVTDYEGGLKGRTHLGGWDFVYDVDGFYDDYTNIQRDENVLVGSAVATVIQNAATGWIAGAEFQFTVIPTSYFQVTAAYTYLQAKYNKFDGGAGVGDVSKSSFPNTPANQLTVTPLVTFPIPSEWGDLTAQANIYYQSKYTTDAYNVANGVPAVDFDVPGAQAPGYTRVDLRVDWRHIKGSPVSLAVYGQNVGNARYIVGTDNQLNTFGVQSTLYSPPPFYGIEARYEFR